VKTKPDMFAFAAVAKRPKQPALPERRIRHLQVRLLREDAVRLRRVAEDGGQSIQSALVDAISMYLVARGQPAASDPGTSG
jgi:hypothetical protein